MRTSARLTIAAGITFLASCGSPEVVTTAAIGADYPGHANRTLRLRGVVPKPSTLVGYVWVGAANYFPLEDETGRLNIWHGIGLRCQPRVGSRVSVTGKW